MSKFINTLVMMAGTLLLHANAHASIVIDEFSTNQGPVSDLIVGGGGSASQVSTSGSDILGGYRDIYVEEVDNGIADADDNTGLGIHTQVSNGRLSATLDDLVKGFAVITYDGSNNVGSNWETGVDTNGLMSQDWSGTTGFLFEDISNDVIAPVQLIVWTNDSSDGATFVKHILDFATFGDINDGGLYDAFIPVNWFDNFENINWASVGAFQAIFNLDSTQNLDNSEISVDLSLSRAINPIPASEPTALFTFSAGMLMLGFVGYRRRKNQ